MFKPSVQVIATTYEGTRAAIETAVPLAKGRGARLTIVVPRIARYELPDDAPADMTDVAADRYRQLIDALEGNGHVQICLCRSIRDLIDRLISAEATVVVGGPSCRWRMSPEERFANQLSQKGYHVVFAATGPCASGRRIALGAAAALAILLSCAHVVFAQAPDMTIQYGGFVDIAYANDFNHPSNHLFRNRGTTPRVDELDVNMAGAYVRKIASESSRWGIEATGQTGQDSKVFGFSATAPNIAGADWLRHLGPTNASYIAPVGSGLTIQGGIFSSLIGYDSLYAKDNLTYTRPWTGDYTPYLMLGANVAYPVTSRLTLTGFVVNGYWHLANANSVPSSGAQIAYKLTDRVTVKETLLYGPHQPETAPKFWRFFSDSIVERKTDTATMAFEYQLGTEDVATAGDPRALWMAAQAPVRWRVQEPWSLTVRPELAWDRDGRWIGGEQSVKALTATVEYRKACRGAQAIVRGEYRVDDSRGPAGGFFDEVGLTPTQQLFGVAVILTFDGVLSR